MLLGKRPRPPMKRTTSLREISFGLCDSSSASQHPDHHQQTKPTEARLKQPGSGAGSGGFSLDFLETPHFLKSCGLCKRKLVPGRDIYMYRGDSAFCSLECRQQQMNQDERKDNKCSYAAAASSSSKKQAAAAAGGSHQDSGKGETMAAAAAAV